MTALTVFQSLVCTALKFGPGTPKQIANRIGEVTIKPNTASVRKACGSLYQRQLIKPKKKIKQTTWWYLVES